MRNHRLLGCVALIVATLWARGGSAEDARALLAKGNRLFAAGDYQGAYEAFSAGNLASPSAFFLRSMGYSLLKMYQHDKARTVLQDYCKKYPSAADRRKIDEVVASLEVVVQTRLSIVSDPAGAELYIDAEAAGRVGTTPFSGTIEPGKHTVILKREGHYTTTKTFAIAPKQSLKLVVPLEVPFQVLSTPPGASIHLGSESARSLGTTPHEGGIPAGTYKLYLKLPGYVTSTQALEVRAGSPVQLSVPMRLGLDISSTPAGASVQIDGQGLPAKTPLVAEITPGRHSVQLTLEGYKAFGSTIVVTAGAKNSLDAKLAGGLLTMRTNLLGATVRVDAQGLGEAPVERATVPLGRRTVEVSAPGRRPWSSALEFSEGELVETEVKMGGPTWPIWTSGAVALAGAIAGTITAVMAKNKRDDAGNACREDGSAVNAADASKCGYGIHNASTVSWSIAGAAAATGLIYYLFWGRPSSEVKRLPAQQSALRAVH